MKSIKSIKCRECENVIRFEQSSQKTERTQTVVGGYFVLLSDQIIGCEKCGTEYRLSEFGEQW